MTAEGLGAVKPPIASTSTNGISVSARCVLPGKSHSSLSRGAFRNAIAIQMMSAKAWAENRPA